MGASHHIQMGYSLPFQSLGHFNGLFNPNALRFPVLCTELDTYREIRTTLFTDVPDNLQQQTHPVFQ